MKRRLPPLLLAVVLACAAAAAAVAINLVLLGRASAENDPVGQLQPHVSTVQTTTSTAKPTAPTPEVRPTDGKVENDGADD
jgi:hypothetical protein